MSSSLRRAVGYFDGGAPDICDQDTVAAPRVRPPPGGAAPTCAACLAAALPSFDEIYAAERSFTHRRRVRERAASPLALVRPPPGRVLSRFAG